MRKARSSPSEGRLSRLFPSSGIAVKLRLFERLSIGLVPQAGSAARPSSRNRVAWALAPCAGVGRFAEV